jgi:hypothetical protein
MSNRFVTRRAVCLAALAAGCGVPQQVRSGARTLSLYTQSVQRQAERFAETRELVARARTQNITALEEGALEAEQEAATNAHVWRLAGDDGRAKLYQGVLEGTSLAEQQARALVTERAAHARRVAAARGGTSVRAAQLAKASQALAQLAARPDVKADAEFYAGFVKALRKSLDESKAAADQEAQKAAGGASAKQEQRPDAAP